MGGRRGGRRGVCAGRRRAAAAAAPRRARARRRGRAPSAASVSTGHFCFTLVTVSRDGERLTRAPMMARGTIFWPRHTDHKVHNELRKKYFNQENFLKIRKYVFEK